MRRTYNYCHKLNVSHVTVICAIPDTCVARYSACGLRGQWCAKPLQDGQWKMKLSLGVTTRQVGRLLQAFWKANCTSWGLLSETMTY